MKPCLLDKTLGHKTLVIRAADKYQMRNIVADAQSGSIVMWYIHVTRVQLRHFIQHGTDNPGLGPMLGASLSLGWGGGVFQATVNDAKVLCRHLVVGPATRTLNRQCLKIKILHHCGFLFSSPPDAIHNVPFFRVYCQLHRFRCTLLCVISCKHLMLFLRALRLNTVCNKCNVPQAFSIALPFNEWRTIPCNTNTPVQAE